MASFKGMEWFPKKWRTFQVLEMRVMENDPHKKYIYLKKKQHLQLVVSFKGMEWFPQKWRTFQVLEMRVMENDPHQKNIYLLKKTTPPAGGFL